MPPRRYIPYPHGGSRPGDWDLLLTDYHRAGSGATLHSCPSLGLQVPSTQSQNSHETTSVFLAFIV